MTKTSHTSERFIIRLPDGMRDKIKEVAARKGRSMNADIIEVLEKAYPTEAFQQNFHGRIITALQKCGSPAEMQKLLKQANGTAEKHAFPFRYRAEIKNNGGKEKTIFISIHFSKE